MNSLPSSPSKEHTERISLEEMPITKHLVVLRKHLFKIVAVLIGLFFLFTAFRQSYLPNVIGTTAHAAPCNFNHDCDRCNGNIHGTV